MWLLQGQEVISLPLWLTNEAQLSERGKSVSDHVQREGFEGVHHTYIHSPSISNILINTLYTSMNTLNGQRLGTPYSGGQGLDSATKHNQMMAHYLPYHIEQHMSYSEYGGC